MSKVVDERIVSLQFDNRNFEKNIQGTLSTLDNFNKKLKLDGATKGIEHVNEAVKKVDMNPMAKGVETVVAKFSALDVMAVTALTRITNAAIDAGKKMVSSLLIEPKSDGFKEYELMLNAIQTTMAGTGKTAKEVENELKKLDEYADQTVYSTADMLNNLPKFTNAGVELEKATTAMIGIANATAHAGGDAGKASIAFYNLGQAIGTGYLSRMDYNSINNAGIATMEWKNQMVQAAIAQGTLTKVGEDSYKAGKKTYTLQQLFIDGLQQQWATTDVMMKVFGDYGDKTTEIGSKAYESAQNIKTFTQMMESLKATAGTGWKDTWQIIFGDLDGATKLWTGVANVISGILTAMADFRNSVLESALGKGFSNLAERINGVLKPVAKTADNVSKVVEAVKDYNKVVDEIIAGKWGNEKKRWDALTEAGYDWAHAQNLVNEKLGDGKRYATKYSEAQNKVDKSQKKVIETNGQQIAQLVKKSDAELKSLGLTNDQIEALRELQKEADKTGYSLEEFVDNIDKINGRSLLLDSFTNIGKGIAAVFTAIKDAFVDIFEITPEGIGQTLYDLIAGFHKLTSKLVVSDETAGKMKRTFKGLFAILDIVSTIIGGPLKLGFKVLSEILGMFDLNIWDVTAKIGDAIVAFRDWLDSVTDFSDKLDDVKKVFSTFADGVRKIIDAIKSLAIVKNITNKIKGVIDAFMALDVVKDTVSTIRNALANFVDWIKTSLDGSIVDRFCETINKAFDVLAKWISSLNNVDTEDTGENIMSGLVKGITNGAKAVWDAITGAVNKVIEIVRDLLGIHSPSTVMISIGSFLIAGLIAGIVGGKTDLFNSIDGVMTGLSDAAKAALDSMAEIFRAVAAFFPQFKLLNSFALLIPIIKRLGSDTSSGFTEGLSEGAKNIFSTISEIFKSVIEKIKDILGIHSPSVIMMGIGKLLIAGLILGLVGSKTGLFSALGGVVDWIKEKIGELVNYLGNVEWPEIKMEHILGVGALVGLVVIVKKLFDLTNKIVDIGSNFSKGVKAFGEGVSKFGTAIDRLTGGAVQKKSKFESFADNMLKISGAIAILAGSIWLLAQIDHDRLWDAVKAVLALSAVLTVLSVVAGFTAAKGADFGKLSAMLLGLSASLLIMSMAIKNLEFLNETNITPILTGMTFMVVGLAVLMATLGKVTKGTMAKNIDKATIAIAKISLTMLLLTQVIKSISKLDDTALTTGINAITMFGVFVVGLMTATRLAGKNIDKLGGTILKISVAIGMLVLVVKLISKLEPGEIAKGIICMGLFGGLITGLIAATKLAGSNLKGIGSTLIGVSVAMVLMAATIHIVSSLSVEQIAKGIVCIAAFGGMIAAIIAVAKTNEKEVVKATATILAMSIAIAVLAAVSIVLSMVSVEGLIKGVTATSVLCAMLALMVHGLKGANEVKGSIIAMTVAIGLLVASVVILSLLDPKKLATATLALTGVLGMFAVLLKTFSLLKTGQKTVIRSLAILGVMTLVIAAIAGVLAGMSYLPNPNNLIPSATALGVLLLAMSAALKIISTNKSMTAKQLSTTLSMLGVMTGVVAALGVVLSLMSLIPNPNALIPITIALSSLMIVMSGLMILLSKVNVNAKNAMVGIIALTAMVIPLAAFGIAISLIPDLSGKVETVIILTAVMTAMTVLLLALTGIGALIGATGGVALLGLVGLITIMYLLPSFGNDLLAVPDLTGSIATITILTNVMWELTKMLAVLAIVGPLAIVGVGAMASLEALMIATGAMAVTIGALMEKFPALQKFLDTGIGVLKQLAHGLGEIISSFAAGLTSGLPEIGTNLSKFMNNLSGFISGANSMPDDIGKKVANLAGAIMALTVADLLSAISSFVQNGSSFADLGSDLSAFMINAMPFMAGIKMLTPESVSAAKNLADVIITLTGADLINGLTSWLTGGSSLADFGTQLASFGPHMAAYASAVAGIDCAAVEASSKAAKSLAEMAAAIPNSGGMVSWFTGENDMGTFGTQLVSFGTALKMYSVAVTGIVLEPIMQSVEAGKALAEMADIIPNLGGVVSWFTGDNGLESFGTQILSFGMAIKAYSIVVTGIAIDPIMQSVEAGKSLAGLNEAIPNLGGMVMWFTGDNDFASFGTQIVAFGASLLAYSTAVVGLNIDAISSSVKAATQLSKLAEALPSDGGFWSLFKDDKINFTDFGKQISKLGEGLKGYSDKVAGMNASAVSTSIASAKKLVSLIKSMGGLDADGVATFSSAIGKLGKTSVNKFVEAFTSSTSKLNNVGSNLIKAVANGAKSANGNLTTVVNATVKSMNNAFASKQATFKTIGGKLLTSFISGISSKKSKVNSAMKAVAEQGAKGARDKYKNFYNAGSYAVSGFVKGINDNKHKATRAGTALGKAAYEAAKKAIDSNSPSKKFMELGKFSDQGLAKGLTLYSYLATRAAGQLGDDIVKSMQKTLGIHSPAVVVQDEVGKFVVKGLAEGIKKDMTAEEAAEQKAKNIVDAFKDALSSRDAKMETADLEYELWEINNKTVSDFEKTAKQTEVMYDRIALQNEKVALAQGEYEVTLENFGENSKRTQEAYNKYLTEQINLNNETTKLLELRDASLDNEMSKRDRYISNSDLEYEIWLNNNKGASDQAKAARKFQNINERITAQTQKLNLAGNDYMSKLYDYGIDAKETQEAHSKWLEEQVALINENNKLSELKEELLEGELERYERTMTTSDLEYEMWEVHNEAASSAEKMAKKAENVYTRIAAQTEKVGLSQRNYQTKFEEFGANAAETQEAYNTWIQDQIDLNAETKKLLDLRAESIEQANKAATTNMSTSDLEYEKWELNNKNASDAEKSSKKLETTLKNINEQATIVGRARATWEDAKARYGEDSVEANEAYNEYLKSQIDLDTLVDEVTTTYKDAITAQQIARTEYYDLLRTEGKKRLGPEWGWTQEQVEEWARKKTGYDPEALEKLMTEDVKGTATKAAAIVESTYTECMTNSIGSIGTEAGAQLGENVASGLTSTTPGIQSAVQTASATCVTAVSGQNTDWVKLGEQFVTQFAQGVTNAITTATQATVSMVTSAYQAAIDFINNAESNGYTITPRVTPILDTSNIQNGLGHFNGLLATNSTVLANINVRLANDSIAELSGLTEKIRLSNEANHSEIIRTINSLKADINALGEAFEGMGISLDSGAVVGELIGKIDNGLGQIVNHKGRGN